MMQEALGEVNTYISGKQYWECCKFPTVGSIKLILIIHFSLGVMITG